MAIYDDDCDCPPPYAECPHAPVGPRPKLLDLFCCEGGASMGYHRAGFDVYGVDLFQYTNDKGKRVGHNRKRYPFPSWQGDIENIIRPFIYMDAGIPFTHPDGTVERVHISEFAVRAASPPCWKYSITNHNGRDYPDLIAPVREWLVSEGKPYVIENVVGAPLIDPVELCGCMFDLKAVDDDGITLHLQRARLFESNMDISAPRPHDHSAHEWVGGCYGGARRDKYEAKYVRKGGYVPANKAVVEEYMGIDWMTWKGLHQSIPPAYTEHIGRQLIEQL